MTQLPRRENSHTQLLGHSESGSRMDLAYAPPIHAAVKDFIHTSPAGEPSVDNWVALLHSPEELVARAFGIENFPGGALHAFLGSLLGVYEIRATCYKRKWIHGTSSPLQMYRLSLMLNRKVQLFTTDIWTCFILINYWQHNIDNILIKTSYTFIICNSYLV